MSTKLFQVDAFTNRPFSGNPAAVCLLDGERDDAWLQSVAAEMNLSETAYLLSRNDGWQLRWFTPATEVDLCGHATLASAHVLWEAQRLAPDQAARFHTRSGLLTARRTDDWIVLDFPATPAVAVDAPEGLLEALGVPPENVELSRFDLLVEVASPEELRGIQPDFRRMQAIDTRGVIVTSRSDDERYDFLSRFFAPGLAIDEDPVTGSAHCCLGPYWASRLGKQSLVGYQASRRGGVVGVDVKGDRVELRGQAVTVVRGELV